MQVELTNKIIWNHGFQKTGVLADSEHVKRAVRLFENFGFEVKGLSAEEYLLQRSPHYQRIITKFHRSKYWQYWRIRESLLRALLLLDRKQKFSRRLTKVLRTGKKPRLPGTD